MPRAYRLGKRGEAVAASRERIVDVARELLSAPKYRGLSLDSVAEEAGVSRPTIYNHFESKTGLIQAIFDDIGERIQFERVQRVLAESDPRCALEGMIGETCRAWSRDPHVIQRVLALAATDPELAEQAKTFERMRREGMRNLVRRLRDARLVHSSLSENEAVALLGVLTSFTTYDQLSATGLKGPALVRALGKLVTAVFAGDTR